MFIHWCPTMMLITIIIMINKRHHHEIFKTKKISCIIKLKIGVCVLITPEFHDYYYHHHHHHFIMTKKNLLLLTMFTMTMMKYPSLSLCLLLKNSDEHRYNLVSFMIYISILLKWFWFFYTIQKTAVFLFGFVDLPMKTINLWQFLMDVFESFFFSLFLSLFIWLGQVFNSHKVNEHTFNKPVFFIFVTYNNNDFFSFFFEYFSQNGGFGAHDLSSFNNLRL